MTTFEYRAIRPTGKVLKGQLSGESALSVRHQLEQQGCYVSSLTPCGAGLGTVHFWGIRRRLSLREFLIFNQEFLALLKAGLAILQAFDLLAERATNPMFQLALTGVREAIRSGSSISDAMAQYPSFFPELYRASLRSGEQTGALPDVLRRHIAYVKLMISVQEKVVKALSYPAFLILVGLGVVMFLVVYVMPSFANIYGQSKAQLPVPTQWLLSLIQTGRQWLPGMFILIVSLVILVHRWRRTPRGRYRLDAISLYIPVLGDVLLKNQIVRFTRTLSTILSGGIPLVLALTITANAMTNHSLVAALHRVKDKVHNGGGFASALKEEGFLPKMSAEMIEVGETTGSLESLLLEVAEFHESELDLRLSQLTTWIEPVLLLIMGILVGGIVILMYLPIFQMASTIS